jgi:hypothetical protein
MEQIIAAIESQIAALQEARELLARVAIPKKKPGPKPKILVS